MLKLLKVFGRGVLVTVLLPFIVLIWALYGVYCIGLFIFMFFKTTIEYFQGKTFDATLPEDLEARRLLLEQEQKEEQAKDALSMMYQQAMTQTIYPPNEPEQQPNSQTYEENPQDEEPQGEDYLNSYDEERFEPEDEPMDYDDEYGDDLDDPSGN